MPNPLEKDLILGNPHHKAKMGPISSGSLDSVRPISVADLPSNIANPGYDAAIQVIESAYWWLAPSDLQTVLTYADVVNQEDAIRTQIETDGLLRANGNGIESAHPLIKTQIELRSQKITLLKMLGLDPLTRGKLGMVRVEGTLKASKLERFLEEDEE